MKLQRIILCVNGLIILNVLLSWFYLFSMFIRLFAQNPSSWPQHVTCSKNLSAISPFVIIKTFMQNNKDRVSCKITKIACQAIHQVLLQGVRKIKSNSFYLPYFLFSVPFIYCFLFFSFYLVQMLALLLCRFFGRNYFRRNKNLFIFLSKTITIHKLQNPLH